MIISVHILEQSLKPENRTSSLVIFNNNTKKLLNSAHQYKNKLNYVVSCNLEDFKFLKKKRGKLWDNLSKMIYRISKLPKNTFQDIFQRSINNKKDIYYEKIFKL